MRISYLDVHESKYKHLTINTPSDAATKINVENVGFALLCNISLFNLVGFLLISF